MRIRKPVRVKPPERVRGTRVRTTPRLRIAKPSEVSTWRSPSNMFHVHAHSHFSGKDAAGSVPEMVARADELGQPGLVLTDHGNMSGAVQLYSECRERGIKPYPGEEFYIVHDVKDKKAKRYHIGAFALNQRGYEGLVKLSTLSHNPGTGNFHHKPRIDLYDLAEFSTEYGNDLAITTGCFFGWVTQKLVTEGVDAAMGEIASLMAWFPNTFVELQRHDIDHGDSVADDGELLYTNDVEISNALFEIAQELGAPVVITQDCHYLEEDHQDYHDAMKRMVSWGDDPDDAVFPGDGFHMCDANWFRQRFPEEMLSAAEEGWAQILEHDVVIPELDEYEYRVPAVVPDPLGALKERCETRLADITGDFGDTLYDRYWDRYEEELEVIEYTDFAGYMMLIASVCDWMREDADIFYLARGSASGSLICYLLEITQLDPISWGLRFERFLSKDRTKPPDIDLDVEKFRRDDLLAELDRRFATLHIGTWSQMGIDSDGRGNLVVAWNSWYKREEEKNGREAEYQPTVHHIRRHSAEDAALLNELADLDVLATPGTHAAGLIITSTREEIDRLVPTMYIPSSKTFVSQYTMDDVEALGLVKADFLGLRTLSALKRALEMIEETEGKALDLEDIPLDDSSTFTMLRRGQTMGVFQLEGYTAAKGCQEMKVRSVDDIIVVNALFRPATMDDTRGKSVKDHYIHRRAGWESVTYSHPILKKHLKETHGLTVFQEQVIAILRDLGFEPEELTEFLKAVKASNKKVAKAVKIVAKYKRLFDDLAREAGFTDKARKELWNAIEGFSEYSFNRAHATSYGVTGVRTGWLKKHYPLEYATALLETARETTSKERKYRVEVRKEMGIKLLRPDVNISGPYWSIDRDYGAIRKGLMAIKGVGEKTALELARHQPYSCVQDIIDRCDAKKVSGGSDWDGQDPDTLGGRLDMLRQAGALKSLGIAKRR